MSFKHGTFDTSDTAWKAGTKAFQIFHQEAGYHLDTIYGHHEIVVGGDLDGGTYDLEIMAPRQDAWRPFASGQDADDTVTIKVETIQGIRLVFSAAAPDPVVSLTSRLRGI